MPDPDLGPGPGFHVSARRAVVEIGVTVSVLGALIAGAFWLAARSADFLTDSIPVSVDRALGAKAARLVQETSKPCTNPAPKRYVESILAELVPQLNDSRFAFQVAVVNDDAVNAFALPGGFVTVDYGLLANAETGDEVAGVIAHELEHVVGRHGTRRLLRELGTGALLSALVGGTDFALPAGLVHDFASTAYDRGEESEADARGIELLLRAGIAPSGLARFFERLAKSSVSPPALLSTHPDPGDRGKLAAIAAKRARVTVTPASPKSLTCE
jgi:predicted Zn-dependent protease